MALINCPECKKEISDKAEACPNCGYPINNVKSDDLLCPEFPNDLSIGEQITNWTYDAALKGEYVSSNNNDKIPSGTIHILLHKNGIKLCGTLFTPIKEIHKSQIISLERITSKELEDKSVIGRAAVGAVLLGPLGALVGGMSGIGSKQKNKYYIIINYWDTGTKKPCSLSVGSKDEVKNFIARSAKEWR
jgi:hypothetical protein